MIVETVRKLQIMALLDSTCFGLTYPFLSTYIQSIGGDHVVVGFLSVACLICSLLSKELIDFIKIYGNEFGMIIIFFVSSLTHLPLIFTSNYWFIILGRSLYSMANQCHDLGKDLLVQNTETDMKECNLTVFSILRGCGYIIGPITAGYLYSKGFICIGLLAFSLTLINTCLALTISGNSCESSPNFDGWCVWEKIYRNLNRVRVDWQKSNYKKNWDLMAIKFLYVSCVMIFYSKFTQILKHSFKSSPVTIGYTYAYMNGLTFASEYVLGCISVKCRYSSFSPIILMDNSFKILCACLLVVCYSPNLPVFVFMCIPVIFLSSLINSVWNDVFARRKEHSLKKLNDPIKIAAGLTTPIFFGVVCNVIGHHAVIMFSVIPIIVSIYIINKYSTQYICLKPNKKNK